MELIYGMGWDPSRARFTGVMRAEQAGHRDEAGEPYSVLVAAGDRVLFVVDLHKLRGYCAWSAFDEDDRRSLKADFRLIGPDQLFLARVDAWRYTDGQTEWADDAWHSRSTFTRAGLMHSFDEHRGSKGGASSGSWPVDAAQLLWRWPAFGETADLLIRVPAATVQVERLSIYVPDADLGTVPIVAEDALALPVSSAYLDSVVDGLSAGPAWLWTAPVPLRPVEFGSWFHDGARYATASGNTGTIRVRVVGHLRMPTGRLIAAEPGWAEEDFVPFTTVVDPGEYPVVAALIEWDDMTYHTGPVAVAARLDICAGDVATWELATRPDQDARLLGEGEYLGFGVDGGLGAFFDEAARSLAFQEGADFTMIEQLDAYGHAELTAPGVDENVIVFSTALGDGAYPTWIGRDASGSVTCFLMDLLLLRDMTLVAP